MLLADFSSHMFLPHSIQNSWLNILEQWWPNLLTLQKPLWYIFKYIRTSRQSSVAKSRVGILRYRIARGKNIVQRKMLCCSKTSSYSMSLELPATVPSHLSSLPHQAIYTLNSSFRSCIQSHIQFFIHACSSSAGVNNYCQGRAFLLSFKKRFLAGQLASDAPLFNIVTHMLTTF